jgi:DNA-binding XRE family transcriptional regulator
VYGAAGASCEHAQIDGAASSAACAERKRIRDSSRVCCVKGDPIPAQSTGNEAVARYTARRALHQTIIAGLYPTVVDLYSVDMARRSGGDARLAEQFGQRVRGYRCRAGLSLRDVATAARLSPTSLSEIENGKWLPGLGMAIALQGALQVGSIEELLGDLPANPSAAHARRLVPTPPLPRPSPDAG